MWGLEILGFKVPTKTQACWFECEISVKNPYTGLLLADMLCTYDDISANLLCDLKLTKCEYV